MSYLGLLIAEVIIRELPLYFVRDTSPQYYNCITELTTAESIKTIYFCRKPGIVHGLEFTPQNFLVISLFCRNFSSISHDMCSNAENNVILQIRSK